jgi:hypothetical protein
MLAIPLARNANGAVVGRLPGVLRTAGPSLAVRLYGASGRRQETGFGRRSPTLSMYDVGILTSTQRHNKKTALLKAPFYKSCPHQIVGEEQRWVCQVLLCGATVNPTPSGNSLTLFYQVFHVRVAERKQNFTDTNFLNSRAKVFVMTEYRFVWL